VPLQPPLLPPTVGFVDPRSIVHPASSYAWNLDTWHSPSPAYNPTIVKGRKKTPAKLFLCGLMLLVQHVHSKKRLELCGRNSLSVLTSATQGSAAGELPSPPRIDEGDRVACAPTALPVPQRKQLQPTSLNYSSPQLPMRRNNWELRMRKIRMKFTTLALYQPW